MFNFLKKNKDENKNNINSIKKIAALLIHAAKIDENYTDKEKEIINKTIIKLGCDEANSNQILDFTREIKNIDEDSKKKIVESLWNIIYSDEKSDMYEANLMRRLTGLLYLDPKVVGEIKEKIKLNINNDISSK